MSDTIPGGAASSEPQAVGFAAIPNWLVRTRDVSIHDKMVYLVLSSHVTRDDEWFMSHSRIALEAGMSVSSVQRSLDRLKEFGLVTWRGRINPETGARLGNSYRVFSTPGHHERPPRSEGPTPSVSVTEQKKNPEEEPRDTPTPSANDEGFEALWTAWPNKSGKKAAAAAWRRIPLAEKNRIVVAIVAHAKAHRANTPPQYIPHFSTFLNGERWTDPLPVGRERGGRQAEPQRPGQFVVPHGHRIVRDPITDQIIGTEPIA